MTNRDIRQIDLSKDYTGEMVSEAVYLAYFAEHHYEWVAGILERKVTPAKVNHTDIAKYLVTLLDAYFELNPIARTMMLENLMYVESKPSWREPDVMVVMNDSPVERTATGIRGAADICVEVVSPSNADIDYGSKRTEYQSIGVREYWILDPSNEEAFFMRLADDGLYHTALHTHDDIYETPLLPKFQLDMSIVWPAPRPKPSQIVKMAAEMWNK